MNWDNLRYFLELARGGTLTVAARRLNVDHTTVSRRVLALEKSLGRPLFLRSGQGYQLTESGRNLLSQVEDMETAFLAIDSAEPGPGVDNVSGTVRIGATEGYGIELLAPQLAALGRAHPGLTLDLLAVSRMVRLARHEADIVITLERPERGPYIVTRLTDYALRLYASPDYLQQHAPIRQQDDLERHAFVGYIDDLLYSKALQYLDDLGRPQRMSLRSTSILAQQQAARAGAGIAILPCFMARRCADLQEVLPGQVEFVRTFWMTMPVAARSIARMRVTWEHLRDQARSSTALMMGQD